MLLCFLHLLEYVFPHLCHPSDMKCSMKLIPFNINFKTVITGSQDIATGRNKLSVVCLFSTKCQPIVPIFTWNKDYVSMTVYNVYFQYMSVNMIWEMFCKFTVQKAKKGIQRRCISVVGIQLWNNVEMDVRLVNSFLVFKGIIYKNNSWDL